MKKTIKLLSCLLIMALLMTMIAVPAFAEEPDGEITLLPPNGEDLSEKTFELYRIFNATVADGGNAIAYQWIPDGAGGYYFYDLFFAPTAETDTMGNQITKLIGEGPAEGKADIGQVVAWIENQFKAGGDAWVAEFGHTVQKYISSKPAGAFNAVKTTTADSNVVPSPSSIQFSGLEYGYYLVYEVAPNTDGVVRSAILLTTVDNDVDAILKMVTTSLKKMVKRDTLYYEGLSASIGTDVQFYIEVTVPNFQYYHTPASGTSVMKIMDVPDNGFTLPAVPTSEDVEHPNPYTVTCGGTKLNFGTDYTITQSTVEKNEIVYPCVTFDFINFDYLKAHANEKIEITYAATMNTNAGIGGFNAGTDSADVNRAVLEYVTDPYDTEITTMIEDAARVYSFQFDVYKQSSHTNTPLAGAQFKLKKTTAGTGSAWATIDDTTGRISGWVLNEEDADVVTTKLVGEEGNQKAMASFIGLGRGAYELKEVKAPDGYNQLTSNILFEIGGDTDKETGVLTDLYIKSTNPAVSGLNASVETGVLEMTVANTTGSELPQTGGMGTTLFTIGGLILMAAAVGILLTRKQREN